MSPSGPPDPFEGMPPMFGDLARLFASQGPLSWDVARQLAHWMATEGAAESNVDPLERMRLEELLRVAEMHVADRTGLSTTPSGRSVSALAVTRGEWARRSLDAYRPLLERLAESMSDQGDPEEGTVPDPTTGLLGGLAQMFGPVLLGMQAGFMVGHLARRALGQYDLPIPRPPSDEILLVPANLDGLASDWSLPPDDLRMWVCVHEVAHHAVLGQPHVRETLDELLLEYVAAFEVDASRLGIDFDQLDLADPSALQQALGDPEALLGAMQSDEQRRLIPRVEAITAAVEGYVDHLLDTVGRTLIGSHGMVAEALRRRRVEASPGDRYVAQLLGIETSQSLYDRGAAFVRGVEERAGPDALHRLWASARNLPTPAEIDAPGLWLARIELPED